MGIILSLLALVIILFVITYIFRNSYNDFIPVTTGVLGVFGLLCFMIMIGGTMLSYCTIDAKIAKLQQTYHSLTYQLENIDTLYGESRANDRKELFNQIQEWNERIVSGRIYHTNPWTNWLEPIDYENFELIELK